MSRTKKWIIAGIAILCTGLLICGASFAALGFNFRKLNTVKLVEETYAVNDEFKSIRIDADTEDILFELSSDKRCKVVCYEEEDDRHNVRVENNTLMISKHDKNKHDFGFSFAMESPKITVYLPNTSYQKLDIESDTGDTVIPKDFSFDSINVVLSTGDISCYASAEETVSIVNDTGDIKIYDVLADEMKLTADTGDIIISSVTLTENMDITEDTGDVTIKDVTCKNLNCSGDSGDLTLTNVIASEEFRLESDTGDIIFNGCDAGSIYAKSDTGDITGTLLEEMIFVTETDTGDVNVPKTLNGGRCELTTDTGDIDIQLVS